MKISSKGLIKMNMSGTDIHGSKERKKKIRDSTSISSTVASQHLRLARLMKDRLVSEASKAAISSFSHSCRCAWSPAIATALFQPCRTLTKKQTDGATPKPYLWQLPSSWGPETGKQYGQEAKQKPLRKKSVKRYPELHSDWDNYIQIWRQTYSIKQSIPIILNYVFHY